MTEGLERRAQPQDNLRGSEQVNPVTRGVPQQVRAAPVQVPTDTMSAQIARNVSKFASGQLQAIQAKRQERSMTDGQIAAMQGASFESIEMEGDKWAMEGHRVVTAQSLSSTLLRAQEQEINNGAYEADPDTYRATLVNRIDAMTSDIKDERTRTLAKENLMNQMPALIDSHMKQNLSFKEQQNFDTLAQSVDVLSRDNSNTGALIAFATGQSDATAGLSQERRRTAVVTGVVNAFTNNNPAAYAHLEDAGFFTTDNLTSSQLQQVRSAQSAYETRLRQQWNGELKAEMTALEDEVVSGDLNPLVAAERQATIMAKHGMKMRAAEGGQIYDRARAGVEFAEGTRRLNIQAAGDAGNFGLQAELLQGAVIHQESRNNPNAVSPRGASGLMQLMPDTMADPGFGVRNIFEVARSLGIEVQLPSEGVGNGMVRLNGARMTHAHAARELSKNGEVNKAMGTEYLETMLRRYNGDVHKALAAYNWGPANADNWDGDLSKLPEETRTYIRNITGSFNDDRPDPDGQRVEAERNLKEIRERARLEVLESMGPAMAQNDEQFSKGIIGVEEWRGQRAQMYQAWGVELDAQRINTEQQMLRASASARIQELQDSTDLANDTATAVQLETSIASAEVTLKQRQEAFINGTGDMSMDDINQEYMSNMIAAFTESGADLDPDRISKGAADLVKGSSAIVAKALKAQEDQAMIHNAETANTVGSLPKPLKDKALAEFRTELGNNVANYRAENPDASNVELGAIERAAEVKYLAENNIVDDALAQQINLAASGNWVDTSGQARPSTVVGLHSFVSLLAENPALAYQYVPDAQARGRMMAASHMVTSMFPDRNVYTDVDLSNPRDPVANAFYDAVQQVGLTVGNEPSADVTADRVAKAVKLMDSGNITNSVFGGMFSSGPSQSLVPQTLWGSIASSTFDNADVYAAESIDDKAVDAQFSRHVTNFLEEVVPYMPGTTQKSAVTMAMSYVRDRGAMMGSAFVMPDPDEPSISSQMFPGQSVNNTAAVNTAIVEWLSSDKVQEANPILREYQEGGLFSKPSSYSVSRLNGHYVANIAGVGSLVLPLKDIGDNYIESR